MRSSLVKWIISICDTNQLHESIIFFSTMLLDFYIGLSKNLKAKNFQLLAISCFIIANRSLYHRILPVESLRTLSANTYTTTEIEQSILQILKHISYTLYFSTELNYLDSYLQDPIYSKVPPHSLNILRLQCITQLKEDISHNGCRNIPINIHARTVLSTYSIPLLGINTIDLS